jgi:hypothetical protein
MFIATNDENFPIHIPYIQMVSISAKAIIIYSAYFFSEEIILSQYRMKGCI